MQLHYESHQLSPAALFILLIIFRTTHPVLLPRKRPGFHLYFMCMSAFTLCLLRMFLCQMFYNKKCLNLAMHQTSSSSGSIPACVALYPFLLASGAQGNVLIPKQHSSLEIHIQRAFLYIIPQRNPNTVFKKIFQFLVKH